MTLNTILIGPILNNENMTSLQFNLNSEFTYWMSTCAFKVLPHN